MEYIFIFLYDKNNEGLNEKWNPVLMCCLVHEHNIFLFHIACLVSVHRVSKKLQNYFCQNSVKFSPTVKNFGHRDCKEDKLMWDAQKLN